MNIFQTQVYAILRVKSAIRPHGRVRLFTSALAKLKIPQINSITKSNLAFDSNYHHNLKSTALLKSPQKIFLYDLKPIVSGTNGKCLHHDSRKQSPEFILSEKPPESLSMKFVRASPDLMRPYLKLMRMDRPIGTWLVFLPCAWSITMATPAGQLPDPKILLLFGLGSFLMRGAGCVINDMWDKDFDTKVARTMNRPLACGEVTRFQALCFLSLPLSLSLSILLTFNWNTILLGVCSMAPCILYPLAKRFTYWPQAFLGITQGWGVLIAWSETHGALTWPTLTLFASGIFWTMTYDTIYSYQDVEDDLKIGVKSTAIRFGEETKYWLSGFGAWTTAGLVTTGLLCDQSWIYYGGVTAFSAHLAHQIWSVNLNDGEDCGRKFRSNRNLGIMLWAAILAANLLKKDEEKKEDVEE